MSEMIDNKIIVQQFIEQVINRGDLDGIEHFVAKNMIDQNLPPGAPQGIEPYKRHLGAAWRTCNDFYLTIKAQIVEGDWVVTRVMTTGTYRNERSVSESGGQKISLSGILMDRVVNGKIVEHWGEPPMRFALFQSD